MSRVLVLEPDPDVRELFGRLLHHLGHQTVSDAGHDVEVVLLEPASKPARQILASVRLRRPNVRVVCTSVCARRDVDDVAGDAFLQKPFSLAALRSTLGA